MTLVARNTYRDTHTSSAEVFSGNLTDLSEINGNIVDPSKLIWLYAKAAGPTKAGVFSSASVTIADCFEKLGDFLSKTTAMREALNNKYMVHFHQRMERVRSNWLDLANSGSQSLSFDDVGAIIDELSHQLHDGNFSLVDEDLASVNVSHISADAAVAIARITYPARKHLAHWQGFVKSADRSLSERGQDGELAGLV